MKHFLILILVALVTLAVLFAWYNPAMLEDVWLWVIGLTGTVIGYAKELIEIVQKQIKKFNTAAHEKLSVKQ